MLRGSAEREQIHQRQPQREQHAHDDYGYEAHRAEGLALNLYSAEVCDEVCSCRSLNGSRTGLLRPENGGGVTR